MMTNNMACKVKYSCVYWSQTSMPSNQSFWRSSTKGLRYTLISLPGCVRSWYQDWQHNVFLLVTKPGWKVVDRQYNRSGAMWGTHVTEWIHAIYAHSKPNISQFFSEQTKCGINDSPLSEIHRVTYHCIILTTLLMPTHQLGLLSVCK